MFGLFGNRSPLRTNEQAWVERRMRWLIDRFGIDRLRNAEVILPTNEYFPEKYNYDEPSARICLDRMCKYMAIDPSTIELSVRPDDDMPGAAGLYEMRSQSMICIAESQLSAPPRLLATLAHELAHEILLKGGHLTVETSDHEHVTDLLPVFLGTGIFVANATVESSATSDGQMSYFSISKQGYLNSIVLGYALGLFAFLRDERSPKWARHLRTDAAKTLSATIRFLRHTDGSLFHHERFDRPIATPTVHQIDLDLRHTSAVVRYSALNDMMESSIYPEDLLPVVQNCTSDRDPEVQKSAFQVIAEYGDLNAPITSDLINQAWYGQPHARCGACHALGKIKSEAEQVIPALAKNLQERDRDVVCAAASALVGFGRKAEGVEPQILAAIEKAASVTDYDQLQHLIYALRAVSADSKASIRTSFADRDHQVRSLAFDIHRNQEQEADVRYASG